VSFEDLTAEFQRRFDEKTAAREKALIASRSAIRSSANAIRAIHRGETEKASALMGEARSALDRGLAAVEQQPDVRYAGYLQDAQKEYAEARITAALVAGEDVPGPDDLGVESAPYLNGMAEAIGEGRRAILDRHVGRIQFQVGDLCLALGLNGSGQMSLGFSDRHISLRQSH
jgi:translin